MDRPDQVGRVHPSTARESKIVAESDPTDKLVIRTVGLDDEIRVDPIQHQLGSHEHRERVIRVYLTPGEVEEAVAALAMHSRSAKISAFVGCRDDVDVQFPSRRIGVGREQLLGLLTNLDPHVHVVDHPALSEGGPPGKFEPFDDHSHVPSMAGKDQLSFEEISDVVSIGRDRLRGCGERVATVRPANERNHTMAQYLLSVHYVEGEAIPAPEVMEKMIADVDSFNAKLKDSGAWVFAGGLSTPDVATVVRSGAGETVMTDGPFPEAKEHLGGVWVITADDLDAALDWAAQGSTACQKAVEVRPFHDEPED